RCFVRAQSLVPDQPLPQRFPVHVRHDVVEQVPGLPRIVERDDMRMVEPRRDLDFPQETLRTQARPKLRMPHRQGPLAIVLDVVRKVDRGHAAAPDFPLDAIAVSHCGAELIDDGRHYPSLCTIASNRGSPCRGMRADTFW